MLTLGQGVAIISHSEVINGVAWAKPEHTRGQVNTAGRVLIEPQPAFPDEFPSVSEEGKKAYDAWSQWWIARDWALSVINNWRSAHAYPLNAFQMTLRHRAAEIDRTAIVSQRIKRLPAIQLKLQLQSGMELARMQDIGGCRAVLQSVSDVYELLKLYKQRNGKYAHTLRRETDYILDPRGSGYRGVHLIYQFGKQGGSKSDWDTLQIEIQLRSQLQHAWATAVETVGTFLRQALKSSRGEREWLRFFALMGTAMAAKEATSPVPGTPTNSKDLVIELRKHVRELEVETRLRGYGAALRKVGDKNYRGSKYFLLELDIRERMLSTRGFKASEYPIAIAAYQNTEKRNAEQPWKDTVLVSVKSLSALQRAYPAYFLDADKFIGVVREILEAGRSL